MPMMAMEVVLSLSDIAGLRGRAVTAGAARGLRPVVGADPSGSLVSLPRVRLPAIPLGFGREEGVADGSGIMNGACRPARQ